MKSRTPTILVFDSGVGGLTVLDPIRAARPDARFVYVGDTAFFPYGERAEGELIHRVLDVIRTGIGSGDDDGMPEIDFAPAAVNDLTLV